MPYYDQVTIGSIFREPRNRPARFNPQMLRIRVREFSTQLGLGSGKRRRFFPLFQPSPRRRVFGQNLPRRVKRQRTETERKRTRQFTQPLPPKHLSKGFKA